MSIYSRIKCTSEQLAEWKEQVLKYLRDNEIDPTKLKIRFQKNYDGNCKIYTYKQDFPNSKKSIRKDDESPTGYFKGLFSKEMWMGIYWYRCEWKDYLGEEMKDQREWDLADIRKREEIKKRKEAEYEKN